MRPIKTWAVVQPNGAAYVNTLRTATNSTATKAQAEYLADATHRFGAERASVVRVEVREARKVVARLRRRT